MAPFSLSLSFSLKFVSELAPLLLSIPQMTRQEERRCQFEGEVTKQRLEMEILFTREKEAFVFLFSLFLRGPWRVLFRLVVHCSVHLFQ